MIRPRASAPYLSAYVAYLLKVTLGFAVLLGAGACGTVGDITGWGMMIDAPKPFQGKNRNEDMLKGVTRAASVHVVPVENISVDIGKNLAEAVKAAAQDQEIPAVTGGAAQTAHQLTGFATLETTPQGPQMTIGWLLTDPIGGTQHPFKVSRRITGFDPSAPITGQTLSLLPPLAVRAIAKETATRLRATIDQIQGLTGPTVGNDRPIIILPVEGAPGDGRTALPRSLQYLLTEEGLPAETELSPEQSKTYPENALLVKGSVDLVDAGPEAQGITMVWAVLDTKGKELGKIEQQNQIKKGSLDSHWGTTALYAAMGAREGLIELLSQAPAQN